MIDFFKMGAADFWGATAMLSDADFSPIWHAVTAAGLASYGYQDLDYLDYVAGFEEAWTEHDLQIDRVERPWRFEGFGCESRSYEPLVL